MRCSFTFLQLYLLCALQIRHDSTQLPIVQHVTPTTRHKVRGKLSTYTISWHPLNIYMYVDIWISWYLYIDTRVLEVGGFPSVDPEWVSAESLIVSLRCQLWAALINPRRNWWGSQLRILHHDAVIWQTLKQHRGKIVAIELKFNLYCDVLTLDGRFAEAFKFQTTGHQSHISSALFSLRRMDTDVPSLYPTQFVSGLINVFPLNIYLSVDRLMLRYGDADILLYLETLLRSVSRQDLCQWRAPCSSLQSTQSRVAMQNFCIRDVQFARWWPGWWPALALGESVHPRQQPGSPSSSSRVLCQVSQSTRRRPSRVWFSEAFSIVS